MLKKANRKKVKEEKKNCIISKNKEIPNLFWNLFVLDYISFEL